MSVQLTIQNLTKNVLSIDGEYGKPSVSVGALQTKPVNLASLQFDDLFVETVAQYTERSRCRVFLGSVELTAAKVRDLKNRDITELLEGTVYSLTPSGDGDFETIQEAVDAITDATDDNRYVIVLAPGFYEIESLVLKRYVYLCTTLSFGLSKSTVLHATSGHTVTMPMHDCGIVGITIENSSFSTTDSPVHVIDDGLGAGDESFLSYCSCTAMGGGRGIFVDTLPPDTNVLCVFCGVDNPSGGDGYYLDGGGAFVISGGTDGNADTGAKLRNGATLIATSGAGISADISSGTAVDADASVFAAVDCLIDGQNGVKATTGTAVFAARMINLGGIPGTPVDIDATSFMIEGDVALNAFGGPGSAPYENWVVNGTLVRMWTGTWGSGTVQGTDQRPPKPPHGYEFFAYDTAPGGGAGNGVTLVYNAFLPGWVDPAGTVIP